jgi:ATP-dependent Lon protease
MKESALAAMSYLKMKAPEFGLAPNFTRDSDVHIHFPAGAVPKDGPSAGTAIFTTLLSLFTGVKVRDDVAMTGELTLRGNVLPIGGVKEKLLAAHRAGIKRVLLPERNRKDLVDVADDVRNELEIIFVKKVSEIPQWALTEPLTPLPIITGEGTFESPKAEA